MRFIPGEKRFALLELLKTSAPLLCDGALEPLLQKFGMPKIDPAFSVSATNPDWVRRAHTLYSRTGADIFRANTAGASPLTLKLMDIEDKAESLNNSSFALLQEIMESDKVSAAALTPLGDMQCPMQRENQDWYKVQLLRSRKQSYAEQIVYLADIGVNLLYFQNFDSSEELKLALSAAKGVSATETVAHLHLHPESSHSELLQTLQDLLSADADFVGLQIPPHCDNLPELLQDAVATCGVISVLLDETPSSDKTELSPEFKENAVQALQAEAAILGGGLHTTPEHIRFLRQLIDP